MRDKMLLFWLSTLVIWSMTEADWICGDSGQCKCSAGEVVCVNVDAAPRFPIMARRTRSLTILVIEESRFNLESLDYTYGFKTTDLIGLDTAACTRVVKMFNWINCIVAGYSSTTQEDDFHSQMTQMYTVDSSSSSSSSRGHDFTTAPGTDEDNDMDGKSTPDDDEAYDVDDDDFDGDKTDDEKHDTSMEPARPITQPDTVTGSDSSSDRKWRIDSPGYFWGVVVGSFIGGLAFMVVVFAIIWIKCCKTRRDPPCLVRCCDLLCTCCLVPIRCIGRFRRRRQAERYAMRRMAAFESIEHLNISTAGLNNR